MVSPNESPSRRRYIQGLRALAVLMVVCFHARLPVPGGFAGVDVFFVISGYVITAMLAREWQRDRSLDLPKFYIRRFLRLTPALALMLTTTVVTSALLFSPEGSWQTTATAIAATLLFANTYIASSTGGYFDQPAEMNPLLNTWSLSVEEQFYLFLPAVLSVLWAASRKEGASSRMAAAQIGAFGAFSFAIAVVADDKSASPLLGFYGILGRMWEFTIGVVLAIIGQGLVQRFHRFSRLLSFAGLFTLAACSLLIDADTRFPGPWTLAPTLAAGALLLFAGEQNNPVGKFLSSRPMVALGDWSYSIYLWHWPCIVIANLIWPDNSLVPPAAALLSVAPALASYYLVEQPTRNMSFPSRRELRSFAFSVVGGSLAISAPLLWIPNQWVPSVAFAGGLPEYEGETNWRDHDYRFGGYSPCFAPELKRMVDQAPNHEPRCQQSAPGPDIDLALIGDSHAEHLFIGLAEQLSGSNVMYFSANAFPSLKNREYEAAVRYVNSNPHIKKVVVTAFWAGRSFEDAHLREVLSSLLLNGKDVLITDGLPSFPFHPSPCKYRSSKNCSIPADVFRAQHDGFADKLRAIATDLPGVTLLRTARFLCNGGTCSMTLGDEILYADESHLNVLGSKYVGKRLIEEYRDRFVD